MTPNRLLLLAFVMAGAALVETASAQQPEQSPSTGQHDRTQPAVASSPSLNGQLPSGILQMERFSFRPPAESGWDVGKVSEAERSFFRGDSSKAWIDIKDEEYPQCADVRQALELYGERFKSNFESRVKVMAFKSQIDVYDGNECLHSLIIFDATTAKLDPPITTGQHMTEHSLNCIYGGNPNRLLTTIYLYRADDDIDPRKRQAQDFFAGLRFARQDTK